MRNTPESRQAEIYAYDQGGYWTVSKCIPVIEFGGINGVADYLSLSPDKTSELINSFDAVTQTLTRPVKLDPKRCIDQHFSWDNNGIIPNSLVVTRKIR